MSREMIYNTDPYLLPFKDAIDARHDRILAEYDRISGGKSLYANVNNHLYYGLHRDAGGGWVFREYAPNANRIYLTGEFNNWKRSPSYELSPVGGGNWELHLPEMFLSHGDLYKLFIEWPGGGGERIPAYATRVVQDPASKIFSAQVWDPAVKYEWKHSRPNAGTSPLIYECHIGMSSEEEKVSTFEEFRKNVLPYVAELGYNTLQIMALQEHPYYGSFGYQVSSFFALSSRFGTPEEFKALVDDAHGLGLSVVMDIVHSHSVDNESEGLSRFDGREDLYFHAGDKGRHPAWGSRCFDYGKQEVKCFLLSNCKFWMEEYMLDGFRFDGVTSMMYLDHGLGKDFCGYDNYFNDGVDEDAVTYLALANMITREVFPQAVTIAEDVSGMAGLAAPFGKGGLGFDYRMAMGIADHWIKWLKEKTDEQWSPGEIWWELTNRRADEKTISYAECHDQALVGDKTLIFRLMDKEMYTAMNVDSHNLIVERGIALHKMIRLVTIATAGGGYLNFMGNEFGHPEWIDFPREGNGWSYKYARRQWSLCRPDYLRYKYLLDFDRDMIHFVARTGLLKQNLHIIYGDEAKKLLIFSRGNYIFVFNFNPSESYADYAFDAPEGEYRMILDTDEREYNGFARLGKGETHVSDGRVSVYIPARCAVVLEKLTDIK